MDKKLVVSPKTMLSADQATMKSEGISETDLIARVTANLYDAMAGTGCFDGVQAITVIAGPGNNGADAVALAMRMMDAGNIVTTYVLGEANKYAPALKQYCRDHGKTNQVLGAAALEELKATLAVSDLIIDGMFGINLDRALQGVFLDVANLINHANAQVLSIDIPSGMDARNGQAFKGTIIADQTFIVLPLKTGNLMQDAADHHGTMHFVEVGITPHAASDQVLIDHSSLANIMSPRKKNTHKYAYGNVLIVGGHRQMEGAPVLSAHAAYKSGCGLVKILFDATADATHHCSPEVQKSRLRDPKDILDDLEKVDAILFGVGLGRDNQEYTSVLEALIQMNRPLIVDADGLYYLKPLLDNKTLDFSNVLITPHVGELARLLDKTSSEINTDPLSHVRALSRKNLNVLLKGPSSIIAGPDEIRHLHLPEPALAKAGSGDALAGMILTFMAQGHHPLDSAVYGLYLQHRAVRFCLKNAHEATILPSEVISALSSVINVLQ